MLTVFLFRSDKFSCKQDVSGLCPVSHVADSTGCTFTFDLFPKTYTVTPVGLFSDCLPFLSIIVLFLNASLTF